MVHLSYPYMTTGKTIALTIWTFVSKVMSLHFTMLSRFVIAFLPRGKYHMYGQMISSKRAKTNQWRKDSLFNSGAGKTDIHTPRNEVGPLPNTVHGNQLKRDQNSISSGKIHIPYLKKKKKLTGTTGKFAGIQFSWQVQSLLFDFTLLFFVLFKWEFCLLGERSWI